MDEVLDIALIEPKKKKPAAKSTGTGSKSLTKGGVTPHTEVANNS
jgi:hypothetical protein